MKSDNIAELLTNIVKYKFPDRYHKDNYFGWRTQFTLTDNAICLICNKEINSLFYIIDHIDQHCEEYKHLLSFL